MASPPRPDPSALIARVSRALSGRGLPFMLIGGQAVLLHGRPRLTDDVDITVGADPSQLHLLQAVCADIGLEPLPSDVPRFVRDTFVLPARDPASGLRVDFIFSTTPYEREAIGRAVRVAVGGATVPFASAEDLVLHKLFAGRPRDWEDAVGVVRRQGATLDWTYIRRWGKEFAATPGREDMPRQIERLREEG